MAITLGLKHQFPRCFFPRFPCFPLWDVAPGRSRAPDALAALDAVAVAAGLRGMLLAQDLREARQWQQRMQHLGLGQLELLGKKAAGS